ncbi:MAG: trehalose-phosphatase, partial [Candidatus Caldatribacteriota bacterium]
TINLLNQDEKNKVVIVSGREKEFLEKWFQNSKSDFIAEHGAWLKKGSDEWKTIEPLKKEWKNQIKPILYLFKSRTPGSFIQEKEYSISWHYINTDPTFGRIRAMELMDSLTYLTSNLNLEVYHGENFIEIKPTGINKGFAAYQWITENDWDFILAIGDDWSDEITFSYLPEYAYSIKVGQGISGSKYNIRSSTEVRALLKELAKKS